MIIESDIDRKPRKKIGWILLLVFMGLLAAAGAFSLMKMNGDGESGDWDDEMSVEPEMSELEKKVNEVMADMTLEEKIGQMLMISFSAIRMNDALRGQLVNDRPGGFILFSDNVYTYESTLALVNDIKATNEEIPLFIGIDQEGGLVQRIRALPDADVTIIPPMYDLGRTGNVELSREMGAVVARELRAFGVNMNMAPVIDVWLNPSNVVIGDRAFGTTADEVIRMAFPFADGMAENGVIPVFKHFPGHGDTYLDSHFALPVVEKSKEELVSRELLPFIEAIRRKEDVIMMGHLQLIQIDELPTSISRKVVTGLLREELGFEGIVMTDALNMYALTMNYTWEEIYIHAVNAGVDILLMPESPRGAIEVIGAQVKNGSITEERIDESVRRILTLKFSKMAEGNLPWSAIGTEENREIVERIYQ